jgi:histidinol-phosphatase
VSPPPRDQIADLLEAAEGFARSAGQVVLRHFGGLVAHEAKGDGTPVTAADREAEALLRRRIEERFPDHGILGEEFGESRAGAPFRWILDPIDGTKTFVRGVPLFGVLVGVERESDPVVGVAHFPALAETVSAGVGLGCRWNGSTCRVSHARDLTRALVLTTDAEAMGASRWASGWDRLAAAASLARTWGDCYGHVLVATGRAEVMVDPVLSAWDAAPLLPILTEAGGAFTDLGGEATIHGGSGVSTNGVLHTEVLEVLGGP